MPSSPQASVLRPATIPFVRSRLLFFSPRAFIFPSAKTAHGMVGPCHSWTNCATATTLQVAHVIGTVPSIHSIRVVCSGSSGCGGTCAEMLRKEYPSFRIPPSKVLIHIHYHSFSHLTRTESKSIAKSILFETMAHFPQSRLDDYGVLMHRVPQSILV